MQNKNNALEGLRGYAALSVMLAHSLFAIFPYLTARRLPYEGAQAKTVVDWVLSLAPFNLLLVADSAVLIFFVLSGYVLTIRFWNKRDTSDVQSAAVRRYIRLIFPAAASVLFAWALLKFGAMRNHQVGLLDLSGWPIHYYTEDRSILSALLSGFVAVPLQGDTYFNGPLWSIQIELLGSLLLFACLATFGKHSAVLAALAFCIGVRFLAGTAGGSMYYYAILSGFLIHPIVGFLVRNKAISLAFGLVGLFLVTADNSGQYSWLLAPRLPDLQPVLLDLESNKVLIWQSLGAWLLVCGVIGSKPLARICSTRFAVYLGKVSYAVYLLHMPLIMSALIGGIEIARMLGMTFLGAFAVGYAFYLIVLFALAGLFTRHVDTKSITLAWKFEEWLKRSRTMPAPMQVKIFSGTP